MVSRPVRLEAKKRRLNDLGRVSNLRESEVGSIGNPAFGTELAGVFF